MKAFYGSRISENMTLTPEGFLICFNVPIARTGWYDYLAKEVGKQGNDIVKVYRSPDEVFSKKAMASFEGKIVTNNHPPDLLTPENSELYTKGAIQNVRQSAEEQDLLIADLIIYNKTLIDEIQQGKRDVSCGYEYNCMDNGDGTYSQINIVGNHVAVVESGRAGDRVAIMDSKIQNMEGEKKKMNKVKIPKRQRGPVTNLFAAMGLKHFAIDAEPEQIAEAVDALAEEREDVQAKDGEEEMLGAENQEANQIAALSAKVDKLTDIVTKLVESDRQVHEEIKPEDAIDELISNLSKGEKSTGDEENSMTIPVEEMDEDIPNGQIVSPEDRPENPIQGADSAAMLIALKAVRKTVANIKDPKERKIACDSVASEFKKIMNVKPNKQNGYEGILKAQMLNSQKSQKANDAKANEIARLEELHKQRNAQYKKEGK